MNTKMNCIMLVDDSATDNFLHERIIKMNDAAEAIVVKQSAEDALNYLKQKVNHDNEHPELIFLDVNMPGMNGWEFMEEYEKLDKELQSKVIVILLTTSDNPDDKERAKGITVLCDYKTKPLTSDMLADFLTEYF